MASDSTFPFSARVPVNVSLIGLLSPFPTNPLISQAPTTHPGDRNLRNNQTREKFPYSQGGRIGMSVEKTESWLSKCSLSLFELLHRCSSWQRTKQRCLPHYPPPTPSGKREMLINPPGFRFPKSFSQKDVLALTQRS